MRPQSKLDRARRTLIFVSAWVLLLSVAAVPICWGFASLNPLGPSRGVMGDVPSVVWVLLAASSATLCVLVLWTFARNRRR